MAFTTARVFEIAQEFSINVDQTLIVPQFKLAENWLAENPSAASDEFKEYAGACYVLHLLAKTPIDVYEGYGSNVASANVTVGPMSVSGGGQTGKRDDTLGTNTLSWLELAYSFLGITDGIGGAYPGEVA